MGSPSEPQCKAVSPWRGLLITASILSCWIQPTSAQISVVPNPPVGEVEHDVIFNIEGFSGQADYYAWYRKEVTGPNRIARYTVATGVHETANNRYKVLSQGSLIIYNLNIYDSDTYLVDIVYLDGSVIVAQAHLEVYERFTKPELTANKTNVFENDTLALTCAKNQGRGDILWFYNDKPLILNEKLKLSTETRTLIILSVQRKDTGSYQCEIRNPISFRKSDPFILKVNYGPENIMFVPNPKNGETEVKLSDRLVLQCNVESYPPVTYIWQVNGTEIPKFSNSIYTKFFVVTSVTWADSGNYTCLVKNEVTKLSVSKSITVKVVERMSKPKLTANSTKVIENDTLAFTCGTEQEGVDILWLINNKPLILNERMKLTMKNRILTFLSVKREDAGFYQCKVQDPISYRKSDPINLTVNYGPDHITFVPNPKKGETEVKFKEPLMLKCHAESYPPATYIWQVNGTQIPNFSSSIYIIKSVTWANSGKYTCFAKNEVTKLSVSRSITVKVVERMSKPKLTANSTKVIENDTLAFTCGTEQEGVDILWLINNKPLILNERMKLTMKNRILTILSVKREDAGSYQCKVQDPISFRKSDPINLTVNYGPDHITFVPNPKKGETEVKFKEPLMLKCHAESYPPATYIWQVNGTQIPNFSSNIYIIKSVTWANSGKYTCFAKNEVTKLSVSRSITVKVVERMSKPKLTANSTKVIENDTLAFTCGTEQEGVDILWLINNKPLILNERMKLTMKNRILTFLSVKREDAGSYQCKVQDPISFRKSDPIILTVNYGPDHITFVPNPKKGETEVKFKEPLMLKCHAESYPPATYIWQVNGTQIPNFSSNIYIIKSVTWANSGKYTCFAKNEVTKLSVSRSITVKVVERMSKPKLTANSTKVIENDTLAFTCGTEQEGVDILWLINNKPLILNERMKLTMKNRILTFLSVKREDAGSYQCKVQDPISFRKSDPIILTVNYGPDHITFVPNPKKGETEVKFKEPLMLKCHAESYPPATYIWQVNGTQIPNFSSNIYIIKSVTWANSGKYTCFAKNEVTKLSVSRSITVKVVERMTKPKLTANSTKVIENDTLAFTCGTEQEGVDILWLINNKPLILNERMKLTMKNRILTILSVKREDSGSYQCKVRNPITFCRSDPFILTVNYGPDNIAFIPNPKKGETEFVFNEPLMLGCYVESYPPAQYIWQLNGTKIPDFSHNIYVIKNVMWKDSGKYTCLAMNNVTKMSVSKSITVKVVAQSTGRISSFFYVRVITGLVIGILAGLILITIVFMIFKCIHCRKNRSNIVVRKHI